MIKKSGLHYSHTVLLGICGLGLCMGLALSVPSVCAVIGPIAGSLLIRLLTCTPYLRIRVLQLGCFLCGFLAGSLFWIAQGIYRPPVNSAWSASLIFGILLACQLLIYLLCFTATSIVISRKSAQATPSSNIWRIAVTLAITFSAAEILRSIGPLALPWGFWGYGAIDNPLLNSFYPIAGSYVVTFMLWMLSALLLLWWQFLYNYARHRGHAPAAPWLLTLALLSAAALAHSTDWTRETGARLKIRLIHTQWPGEEKYRAYNQARSLAMLEAAPFTARAELTVFPELFLTERINSIPAEIREKIAHLAKEQGTALLFGAVGMAHEPGAPETSLGRQNTLVLLNEQGVAQIYIKRLLLPFTEYLPTEFWLQWIWPHLYHYPLADLVPGPMQQPTLKVRNAHLGPLICSELASPVLSALQGSTADIVISPSSDSWIPSTLYLLQAHHLARIRAAELQKPLARANNVGVSAFIDHRGKVLASLSGEAGSGQWTMPTRTGRTPYVHIVEWFAALSGS